MCRFVKVAFFSLMLSLAAASAYAAETYIIDGDHTEVIFRWNHLGVSFQHGEFTGTSGTLLLDTDQPENSSIEVIIDPNSIITGVGQLDDELKGAEFFRTFEFTTINFKSTSIEKTGDDTAKVSGDLTVRGVTKAVTLDTKMTFSGRHPFYGGDWVAFKATTAFDPTEFGMGWGMPGLATVEINTELKQR